MKYQIAIYSADAVFARMLELEFLMRGKSVFCAEQPLDDLFAEIVLLDLDTCTPPAQDTYGRMIGFTTHSALLADEARRQCSMILHRPFEMRLLRREVFPPGEAFSDDHRASIGATEGRGDKSRIVLAAKNALLTVEGVRFQLSPNELRIVRCLMEKRGEAVSRAILSQSIGQSSANKVDVYVCYLRRKLDQKLNHKLIHTVRGQVYMIKS